MNRWEVCSLDVSDVAGLDALDRLLVQGWEPFAVTETWIYHLKRVRSITPAEWVKATSP